MSAARGTATQKRLVERAASAEGFDIGLGFTKSLVGSDRLIVTVARRVTSIARADGARGTSVLAIARNVAGRKVRELRPRHV
jgi:hypothetical protein